MKRFTTFLVLLSAFTFAKLNVALSIAPESFLLEQIAKDKVAITTIVKPGSSPHTYEPKPSQMISLSNANIYLAIGVEFEKVWLPKFKAQNSSLEIIHVDKNITKIAIDSGKKKGNLDPHIWLSVSNLKTISKNIAAAIIKKDIQNSQFYKNNLEQLLKKLDSLDSDIKSKLSNLKNRKFLIFHPSWGYFAKEYNLTQIAVEIEGKSPKPKELIKIIEQAKEENIKIIFTQPEFSKKSASIIANEIGGKVVEVSPLTKDVLENIRKFAYTLAGESLEQ